MSDETRKALDAAWGLIAPVEIVTVEPQPDEHPECGCKIDGPRRNVLIDIDEGRINAVVCANCELSLPYGSLDDMIGVHGEGIPLVMTTTVEKHFNPLDMIYPEYDVYYELSAHPHEVSE